MYQNHFGLKKRPFRAHAAGPDVFVGPQTAATMAGLKKALSTSDSIVAVSGPAGVGKTTLVRRALNAAGDDQTVISVGRIQLGHDEVLELLLEEMGVELPAGTVQRFTTFRRLLLEQAEKGSRVFVVVEDAARIGVDALAELEALTAADAGISDGANVILMGDEDINDVLNMPRLARLKQRLRLGQIIKPLCSNELTAYFKHCFRLAGNEFDTIFEQGASEIIHELSNGIPRMANNIVESALTTAAESDLENVSPELIRQLAIEEFGLKVDETAPATPVANAIEEPEPKPVPIAAEPVAVAEPEPDAPAAQDDKNDIPEFIQDTLPDLQVLTPHLLRSIPSSTEAQEPSGDPPDIIPDAQQEADHAAALQAAQVPASGEELPEWERDPTLAQLRPDLDALEHAMAVAQGLKPESGDDAQEDQKPEEPPEPVPEITLDQAIQNKIDEETELQKEAESEAEAQKEAEEAEKNAALPAPKKPSGPSIEQQLNTADPDEPVPPVLKPPEPPVIDAPEPPVLQPPAPPIVEPAPPPVVEQPELAPEAPMDAPAEPAIDMADEAAAEPVADAESNEHEEVAAEDIAALQEIAANLSRARTIDDVDDKMAETLFGEEFSAIAAQVAANAPPELSGGDDNVVEQAEAGPDVDRAIEVTVELESTPSDPPVNILDASASRRLATVRALNGEPRSVPNAAGLDAAPEIETAAATPAAGNELESFEDQINTSLTQTLKALSVRPPPPNEDAEDLDDKSGFFNLFRRS